MESENEEEARRTCAARPLPSAAEAAPVWCGPGIEATAASLPRRAAPPDTRKVMHCRQRVITLGLNLRHWRPASIWILHDIYACKYAHACNIHMQ